MSATVKLYADIDVAAVVKPYQQPFDTTLVFTYKLSSAITGVSFNLQKFVDSQIHVGKNLRQSAFENELNGWLAEFDNNIRKVRLTPNAAGYAFEVTFFDKELAIRFYDEQMTRGPYEYGTSAIISQSSDGRVQRHLSPLGKPPQGTGQGTSGSESGGWTYDSGLPLPRALKFSNKVTLYADVPALPLVISPTNANDCFTQIHYQLAVTSIFGVSFTLMDTITSAPYAGLVANQTTFEEYLDHRFSGIDNDVRQVRCAHNSAGYAIEVYFNKKEDADQFHREIAAANNNSSSNRAGISTNGNQLQDLFFKAVGTPPPVATNPGGSGSTNGSGGSSNGSAGSSGSGTSGTTGSGTNGNGNGTGTPSLPGTGSGTGTGTGNGTGNGTSTGTGTSGLSLSRDQWLLIGGLVVILALK